jgi:protoheme IX farnesyltransferase
MSTTIKRVFKAYMNLARLRILGMVLIACAIGFVVSYRGQFDCARFFWTLLGTGLLSGGSCALNCYVERETDALMQRTRGRPIPAGVISPRHALMFGLLVVSLGTAILLFRANPLSAILGLTSVVIYVAIYTPAKRITWLNTSIGSIPGAVPPLIGWSSATGQLDASAWILFSMLFLWQHTHFFPIAWMLRDEYRTAGFCMLPVIEPDARKTFVLTVVSAIALLGTSLFLCGRSATGIAYIAGSVLSGCLLIRSGVRLLRSPTMVNARAVLFQSLIYLPIVLLAILFDRYGVPLGNSIQNSLACLRQWT